jgi:hypothetical protein
VEQLAHNALFNATLLAVSGRLPLMLHDIKGVTDFSTDFAQTGE